METYPEVYDKPDTRLTKPLRIGEYSCHADLSVNPNASNLRYLIHIDEDFKPDFDLGAGFKNYIPKDRKNYENDLSNVQNWAVSQRHKHEFNYSKVFRNAEIVCGRGTLTDIAKTSYYKHDSWRMVAVHHNGIIYIHDCGVIDGKKFAPPKNQRDAHCTYWGHKFFNLMTSKNPDLAPLGTFNTTEVVDCRETYSIVNRSDIIKPDGDRIKLAYSSEIKAVDENDSYVDFKTQASHLSNDFWLKKAWFWWLQCHIASVDRVYAGIRSDLGVVHKIEKVEKSFIREQAGKKCNIVMTFLATVLSEVKKRAMERGSLQVSYCPKTKRVHFEAATRNTDFLFLHTV